MRVTGTTDVQSGRGSQWQVIDLYDTYGLKKLSKATTREIIQTSTPINHIAGNESRNIVNSGVIKIALSEHHMAYWIREFRGALAQKHKTY